MLSTSYDLAVAIPTLVGSLLSCFASGSIFLCYILLPQIPHWRHVFILNLAGADFVNSLNNSISGIYLLATGNITAGPACTVNGFVGMLSVEATDFSVLAIALATFFSLRGSSFLPDVSPKTILIVTGTVWTIPVVNSCIALGLGILQPVSGNWCWIDAEKPALRYALGHGWRFLIILVTVGLYIGLYTYFRKEFTVMQELTNTNRRDMNVVETMEEYQMDDSIRKESSLDDPVCPLKIEVQDYDDDELVMRRKEMNDLDPAYVRPYTSDERQDTVNIASSKALTNMTSYQISLQVDNANKNNYNHSTSLRRKQSEIQKVLLLNAYPIAYVVLWLPGIINRMVELGGTQSRVLRIMQSSTQFVGVANAITYGYNEGVKREMTTWLERRRRRAGN